MNILLIYPKFPETFWSFSYALSFIGKKAAFPPLSLLTVAALLPEEYHTLLVDLNVRKLRDEDLLWADLVFISSMAIQRDSANTIITRCRELQIKVAAGGPLFTSEPDQFPEVDYLILAEAELALPLFLADWWKGTPKRGFYQHNKKAFPKKLQALSGTAGTQ